MASELCKDVLGWSRMKPLYASLVLLAVKEDLCWNYRATRLKELAWECHHLEGNCLESQWTQHEQHKIFLLSSYWFGGCLLLSISMSYSDQLGDALAWVTWRMESSVTKIGINCGKRSFEGIFKGRCWIKAVEY